MGQMAMISFYIITGIRHYLFVPTPVRNVSRLLTVPQAIVKVVRSATDSIPDSAKEGVQRDGDRAPDRATGSESW